MDPQWENRCIRVVGDAMRPIATARADVAFADAEELPIALDGKLVVAVVERQYLVRWFHYHGLPVANGKKTTLRSVHPEMVRFRNSLENALICLQSAQSPS